GKNKSALHHALPEKQNQDYFTFELPDTTIHEKYIKQAVKKAWDGYSETTVPFHRLLLDGSDFSSCQPALPAIIEKANEAFDDIAFVHSSLQDYVDNLLPLIDKKRLKIIKGELRDGGPDSSSANALATRMYLKILNRKAQNLLLKQAEPLAAVLFAEGNEYLTSLFEKAWSYLFQSHAHDTINGVAQDKTADDAEYRLKQAIETAESIIDHSAEYLAANIKDSRFKKDDILLLCINSLPQNRRGVVKVVVDIPRNKNCWDFAFADENGNELHVQHISRKEHTSAVYEMDSRSWPFYHDRHEVYLETSEIPAGGYSTLKMFPGKTFKREAEWWPIVKTSRGDELSQAPGIMENEFLSVEIDNGTGTIDITFKESGRKYKNLHYFTDEGDMGDYWVNYPHYHNQIFDSRSANHKIWMAENGPLAATIAVETTMELPAFGYRPNKGTEGDSKRSSETRQLLIISEFTLKKGERKLNCKTTVKNNIRDHRLRLCLPTGINAEHTNADGHFIVENRPVQPQKSADGDFYPGMQTLPMQRFVDISDGKHGFAFLTNSIGEYEMLRDKDHTLVLTLFRSVENRICSEYRSSGYFPEQEGGQCLRDMVFEYALMPHAGDWKEADVPKYANQLNVPLMIYQFSPAANGVLPASRPMFSVSPSVLQVSALKKSEKEDALLMRMYNPAMNAIEGKISFTRSIEKVTETNLIEEEKNSVDFTYDSFICKFEKGKIKTFKVYLKR
ncbi:MAG: glycoside hydrolase family 38 C-terminal domain-containing protein, partial [Prolixibacteraceae bacterium]